MSYTKAPEARDDALAAMVAPVRTIEVYAGARPAHPGVPPGAAPLARFDSPRFGTPAGGALEILGPLEARALAPGDMGWFRLTDAQGRGRLDGEIGPGKEYDPSSVTISAKGQIVRIDGGKITMPV